MGDENNTNTGTTGAAATGAAATAAAAAAAKTPAANTGAAAKQPAATGKPGAAATGGAETGKTKAPPTVLEGSVEQVRNEAAAGEGGDETAAATWPDDWREQIAGGNAEVRKLIGRYGSPQAVANALHALRSRLGSGEFTKALGKDATDDEIAQFRKDNNIPDKPEGYELPKGLAISDKDKPIVDKYLSFAHGKNQTPGQVQETLDWYFKARDEEKQQQYERDVQYRDEQHDGLQGEYGREFRGFSNTLKNFVPHFFGKELAEELMEGRGKSDALIGNNGAFLRKIYELARLHAPEQSLTGAGEIGNAKALNDRIAEIEKLQRTDRNKYFADEKMQAEYANLIGTKLKMEENDKARAKAA